MDEKKRILKVLEKSEEVTEIADEQTQSKTVHSNQTNPIYKKLAQFNNVKIGDKWSIKDLLK